MAAISITVKDTTPELLQKLDAAIGRFVVKGAAYVEGQLKVEGSKAKSGRPYQRGESVHIASAPGESPASDSSNLYGSIDTIVAINRLEAKIGTPVEYAIYLEDPDGLNRPLWEATAKASLPTLEKILDDEVGKIRR